MYLGLFFPDNDEGKFCGDKPVSVWGLKGDRHGLLLPQPTDYLGQPFIFIGCVSNDFGIAIGGKEPIKRHAGGELFVDIAFFCSGSAMVKLRGVCAVGLSWLHTFCWHSPSLFRA